MIDDKADMRPIVMRQLARALEPTLRKVQVKFEGFTANRVVPERIPPIANGERLNLYALGLTGTAGTVVLTGIAPDESPYLWKMNLDTSSAGLQKGNLIHRMAAWEAIRELEDHAKLDSSKKKEIQSLALQYTLASSQTSFVAAVDNTAFVDGPMHLVNVNKERQTWRGGGSSSSISAAPPPAAPMIQLDEIDVLSEDASDHSSDNYDEDDDEKEEEGDGGGGDRLALLFKKKKGGRSSEFAPPPQGPPPRGAPPAPSISSEVKAAPPAPPGRRLSSESHAPALPALSRSRVSAEAHPSPSSVSTSTTTTTTSTSSSTASSIKTDDVILLIATKQNVAGFWGDDVVPLLSGLPKDFANASPASGSTDKNVLNQLWISALVLAWLQKHRAGEEGAWRLFSQKARTWIKKTQISMALQSVDFIAAATSYIK